MAALVVMIGGTAAYAICQVANRSYLHQCLGCGSHASSEPSPSPLPAVVQPLTGELGGDYCPVAHRGNSASWKGSFLNITTALAPMARAFSIMRSIAWRRVSSTRRVYSRSRRRRVNPTIGFSPLRTKTNVAWVLPQLSRRQSPRPAFSQRLVHYAPDQLVVRVSN